MVEISAQVDEWVRKTERRMTMVFRESAQQLFSEAQRPAASGGSMPIDTGFLRNSFVAGLNGSTSLTGADSYVAAIAGRRLMLRGLSLVLMALTALVANSIKAAGALLEKQL